MIGSNDGKKVPNKEYAYNLLSREQNYYVKWTVSDFVENAWVKVEFEQPMLLRGYGLRTTSDAEENDPKSFELFGVDYLITRIQDEKNDGDESKMSDSLASWSKIDEKWVSLHSVKE